MKLVEASYAYFESGRNRRIIASFLVVAAIFAYLMTVSWHKWGDLIVDTSREIWVPYRILQGKALYRDIYYFHGPLPAYLLALLYGIFGVSISTPAACGTVVALLMCLCIYKLSRIFMDEVVSVVIVANFCFAFAFNIHTYDAIFNYILPYSFASTFCMLFIAAALYCFLQYLESGGTAYLAAWGALLTLSALSRPETALSVWIVFLISGLLARHQELKSRVVLLFLPILMSSGVYGIVLHGMQAFDGFRETLLGSVLFASKGKDPFVVDSAGLNEIFGNSLLMFKAFLYHLITVAGLCFGSLLVGKSFIHRERKLPHLISGVLLIAITAGFACRYLENPDDLLQYRCIPLVLLFMLLSSMFNMIRGNDYRASHKMFTLALVALVLLSKILFNSTPVLYGFYLLNIGLVAYYLYFVNLTSLINRKYFPSNIGRFQFIPLMIAFASLFFTSWGVSADIYKDKNLKVDSGKGIIYCWNDEKTTAYWDTVNYLRKNSLASDTLVVIPEGASLNFYSDRVNPLKHILFLPGDIEKIGEEAVATSLEHNKVTYIALVKRSAEEYGRALFGLDYGIGLSGWILENYAPVRQFGAVPSVSDRFVIQLLKRKESRPKGESHAHTAP